MNATKILSSEISKAQVSSLPTRPTSPTAIGGAGYTSTEMKEAFDKLPKLIAERFNKLLDDIALVGYDSLAGAIPTGLRDGHTLTDLFFDLSDGEFAAYLIVGNESLTSRLLAIEERITKLEGGK